uniref:Uncharacterized protein n=1 Tax=Oryza punctata TaxID=4537 RepID=A0A0E0K8A8_ORYPU
MQLIRSQARINYLQFLGTLQVTEYLSFRGVAMNLLQSWSMSPRSSIFRRRPTQQLACMVHTVLRFRPCSQRPAKMSVLRNLILTPSRATT